jgi:pimeloyl-ACP methyl ester carboxylesterase
MAAEVILVHGAFHGSWCWERVVPLVREAGINVSAVELPFTSFAEDVEAVRSAVAAATGPVVLCGHSYGGAVISEAGDAINVRRLIYLCAFALAEGRSTMDPAEEVLPSTDGAQAIQLLEDGKIAFDTTKARATFYGDCTDAEVADACGRLRPMATDCMSGRVTRAAWRDRPSVYAICTNDGAIHPDAQRAMAAQCTESTEWASSHSPFLSRPEVVADFLCEVARRSA